jgi:hypothetical protein
MMTIWTSNAEVVTDGCVEKLIQVLITRQSSVHCGITKDEKSCRSCNFINGLSIASELWKALLLSQFGYELVNTD